MASDHTSRQQQARQSEESPSAMEGRTDKQSNHLREQRSAVTIPSSMTQPSPRSHKTISIASFGLRNATLFGDFNLDFNVLNNVELENSGLTNEYDIDCDATGIAQTPSFDFGATGVVSGEFINLKCDKENMLIEQKSAQLPSINDDALLNISLFRRISSLKRNRNLINTFAVKLFATTNLHNAKMAC